MVGRSAATIGRKRTLDNVTASATSSSDAVFSVEIRMTCAGAAQISSVDSAIHHRLKPDLVGQRAHADVVADENVEEHRADGRYDAVEEHLERGLCRSVRGIRRHAPWSHSGAGCATAPRRNPQIGIR